MMNKHVALSAVALVCLGAVDAALAARLSVSSPAQVGQVFEQSASIDGVQDAWSLTGEPLTELSSGQVLSWASTEVVERGGVTQGVSHVVSVDAQSDPARLDMMLSMAQSWDYTATSVSGVSGYQLTQDLYMDLLQLQIVADAGEVNGQSVRVSWSGLLEGLWASDLPVSAAGSVDLVFSRQGEVLGSHSLLASGALTQPAQITFLAAVGDVLDVSWIAHQQATQTADVLLQAGQNLAVSQATLVTGQMSVSAVPEPQSLALLLAGLGVVAVVRCKR